MILLILAGVTLLVAALIFVQTWRLGAPPMPSNGKMRHAVLHLVAMELVHANRPGARVLDLGSGWGGLTRRLAAEHPDIPVIGVERSVIPLLWSVFMQRLLGPVNAQYKYGDILKPGVVFGVDGCAASTECRSRRDAEGTAVESEPAQAGPTLLLAYLAPDHMERIGRCLAERDGSNAIVLISAAFALHGYEPERVETLTDLYRTRVYLYRGLHGWHVTKTSHGKPTYT